MAKAICTEAQYQRALDKAWRLMDSEPGSQDEVKLIKLVKLIERYERENYRI